MNLADRLQIIDACPPAIEWVETHPDHSLAELWAVCKRADWLLWLAGWMADKPGWPTRLEVVLAICDCAEIAPVKRPIDAIRIAQACSRGEITIDQAWTAIGDTTWTRGDEGGARELDADRPADWDAYDGDGDAWLAILKSMADIVRRRLSPGPEKEIHD